MAKDPAFLFYPNDWIGGTMGMTFEEKGAYMELLMMQFNRGHMTSHMIGQTVGQLFGQIQGKFSKDENGLWFNNRLDEEKNKRQNYVKSRLNNRSGQNQHSKKEQKNSGHMKEDMLGHMTSHMVNENVNTGKEEKEGVGEKEGTPVFVVPEMLSVWRLHKPKYIVQREKDFPALRKIAELIADQEQADFSNGNGLETVKNTWDAMCAFIVTDNHFTDYTLFQIEKYIQAISSKMLSEREAPVKKSKVSIVEANMNAGKMAKELLKKKYA